MSAEILPILEFANALAQQTADGTLQLVTDFGDALLDQIDAVIGGQESASSPEVRRPARPKPLPWPGPYWG